MFLSGLGAYAKLDDTPIGLHTQKATLVQVLPPAKSSVTCSCIFIDREAREITQSVNGITGCHPESYWTNFLFVAGFLSIK